METQETSGYRNDGLEALSKTNGRLSTINIVIVLCTVSNLIFDLFLVFLAFLLIYSSSAKFSVFEVVDKSLPLFNNLLSIMIFFPISLSALVIILMTLREVILRQGRILFELLGEVRHKTQKRTSQIGTDLQDQFFIQIKMFAMNEKLPFLITPQLAPLIYIFINVAIAFLTYSFLIAI